MFPSHAAVATFALPRAERTASRVSYRDALVAPLVGYRPLLLDLVLPAGEPPATGRAVVVYLHGGTLAVGSHKHGRLADHVTDRLVDAGFAVARAQYRHGREAGFPAQIHDVKAAVRWIRHHADGLGLDAPRVAAWGHSAGGYLTAMLAVTADSPEFEGDLGITGVPSGLRAGIAWNPPTDFTHIPRPPASSPFHSTGHDPHDWLPTDPPPALASAASPLFHVSATAAPLLLVHGTEDTGVPIAHSEALVAAYWRAGADADLLRLEGVGHSYGEHRRQQAIDAGIAFLHQHLGT